MIGLSVSQCCAEMAQGKVDPATVEKIVSRTACESQEDWDRVLRGYRGGVWDRSYKDEASRIAKELWATGKIVQPRLIDGSMPDISSGIWVDTEDQISYVPYPYRR